jgi:transcriptional regulator with XRE-family HTH domain
LRPAPSRQPSRRYGNNGNFVLHYTQITQYEGSIMPTPHRPSVAVRRTLRKLGLNIYDARRRRGLPAEVVAERAFTSRPTLRRIEEGDHAVSIGIYAAVLQALGLLDGLGLIADPGRDEAGLAIASEKLPERVRLQRPREAGDAK